MQATKTKLTLDHFFRIMGLSPLHAHGVYLEELSRTAHGTCGQPIFQYDWQAGDRVGREQVAEAIASAEADIESIIGYHLAPAWDEDEWVHTTRPYRPETVNFSGTDVRGFGQLVSPRWGYMISGGIRSVETLDDHSVITYTNDRPPASYDGLATLTLVLATELPDCEIAVFYPGHAGDERWRIRPVRVAHTAGLTYTITFRRELALVEDLLNSYDLSVLRSALGTDDANFLDEVAVCRIYNDPIQQATFLWEPPGSSSCGCGGSSCGVCGYGTQTGCFLIRGDPRLSMIVPHPAEWDADTLSFAARGQAIGRQPDLVRLWYYSGWRDKSVGCPTLEMDEDWARVVAQMAASRLDRPVCACGAQMQHFWATDLAFSGGAAEVASYNVTAQDLSSPFGTRRGEIAAWRRVRRRGTAIARGAYDGA